MSAKKLFLVKEICACVARDEEDLSEYAIFRKHTFKVLRQYLRLSLEYGRIPSVLGEETVRARVSHTKMHTMEDETIFIHDINHCLKQVLNEDELRLVALVVFMDHTFEEAAALRQYSIRQTYRMFYDAMDRLTRAFFERDFLDAQKLLYGKKKPVARARVRRADMNEIV